MIWFLLMGIAAGAAIGYLVALVRYKKPAPEVQKAQLQLIMEQDRTALLEKDLTRVNELLQEERAKADKLNTEKATLSANFSNLKEKLETQKKQIN